MFAWIKKLFSKKNKKANRTVPLKDADRASKTQMQREAEKIRDGTFKEPARDARRSHPGSVAGKF